MKKIFCTFSSGKTEILDEIALSHSFDFLYSNKINFENVLSSFYIKVKMSHFFLQKKISKEFLDLGKIYGSKIGKQNPILVSIRWIDEKVQYGLFAEENMSEGAYIGEYTGVVKRQKEYLRMNNYLHEYALQSLTGNYYAIDAEKIGNETRFMNHSNCPNVRPIHIWKANLFHKIFITTREVRKGEQLCYDYGKNYWGLRAPPSNLLKD